MDEDNISFVTNGAVFSMYGFHYVIRLNNRTPADEGLSGIEEGENRIHW